LTIGVRRESRRRGSLKRREGTSSRVSCILVLRSRRRKSHPCPPGQNGFTASQTCHSPAPVLAGGFA
jgi:hypothetical protein